MTTVHLILRDTDDGLVDVETTITGFDRTSNAQRMADELNAYLAHQHKQQGAALLSDKPVLELARG